MTQAQPPAEPVLAVENLTVSYRGGARAVRDLSLTVGAGECLALLGESGCGKSTVAMAVLGLLPPDTTVSGSVRLAGAEIVGASRRDLRGLRGASVGLVAQSPFDACDPLRRVGAHVTEAWRAKGLRPAPGAEAAAVTALGIPDAARALRRYPHQWSGGMLQRATIAAASALQPPLLVADEPTSALDAGLADAVLTSLRATGAAVLLISHDARLVAEHADRVAVCYAGRVVEAGSARDVLARPRHPYTQGLLAALPRPGAGLPTPIPGAPPDPRADDDGCAFAPRCAEADDDCRADIPPSAGGVACLRARQ